MPGQYSFFNLEPISLGESRDGGTVGGTQTSPWDSAFAADANSVRQQLTLLFSGPKESIKRDHSIFFGFPFSLVAAF